MSPPIRLSSLSARRSALSGPARAPVQQAPSGGRPLAPSDSSTFERPPPVKATSDDTSALGVGPERGGLPRVLSFFRDLVGRLFRTARPSGDPSSPDDSPTSSQPSVHHYPGGTTTE